VSFGDQLRRAELLATDSSGKRVPRAERSANLIRCRETRTYVQVSYVSLREEQEDKRAAQAALEWALEGLSADEYAVMKMRGKIVEYKEVEHEIPAGELHLWELELYTLVEGSRKLVERPGLPPIETVMVEALEPISIQFSLLEVSLQLSISVRQVRRLIESGQRKLKRKR
jgi:hypothetical protein